MSYATVGNDDTSPDSSGYLLLKIMKAELTRDTEYIGKMDPFVQIEYQSKIFKTNVCDGAGKFPEWNFSMKIPVTSMGDEIRIVCYDEDITSNDLIGDVKLNMSKLCTRDLKKTWLTINYKNK